ncbi:uncharacterized protein LOC144014972 [Festucalex cinctus]
MLRILLLVLCVGGLEAWFWRADPQPTITTTTLAPTTANTTPGGTKKVDEEDEDLSGVGEELINVTTSPETTQGSLKVDGAELNTTGNIEGSGIWESDTSGSGSGSRQDLGSGVESVVLPINFTDVINVTLGAGSDPLCLPVPSGWHMCSRKRPQFFALPNFFNHTSVEQVEAALQEWARLTRAGCHQHQEWFLCLLLVPRCPSNTSAPLRLPCRSFCHQVQDSCWASLNSTELPVNCGLLPVGAQEPGSPACASVSYSEAALIMQQRNFMAPGDNVCFHYFHIIADAD